MPSNTYSLPHILGKDSIKQLASNLYAEPKSALKEAITNGLDQYVGLDAVAKIHIKSWWGSDIPLKIRDFATGIVDIKQFTHVGEGKKEVAGRVSSYEQIDPDIGGNKGFGKLGFLQLAGGDDPKVIFRSHRPETDKYNALGMIVTMRPVVGDDAFKVDEMKSTMALQGQGCEVQIPKTNWALLGRESNVKEYIKRMFALRIADKVKPTIIAWNNEILCPPIGFDPTPYKLFQLDSGEWIYGNFRKTHKLEPKNVWIYCKRIGVTSFLDAHKCIGWINDNFIIPTMSREDLADTPRWREIQDKLKQYLDKNFDKPTEPKVSKMGKENEKRDIVIDMLRYQNELLRGESDKKGVQGEITGGANKAVWTKKMTTLTNTGGGDGTPIIPIGDGTRKHGLRNNGSGQKNSSGDGGNHPVLVRVGDDQKATEGLIKPNIRFIPYYAGPDAVACYMPDAATVLFNTYWPHAKRAFEDKKEGWKYLFVTLVAEAILSRNIAFVKNANIETFRKKCAEYIKRKFPEDE